MPKQTPSIPNEILWSRLGDRSALSDELWLIAAQVGMLLGRSTDQLAEDRKVGNPPPFKKDGGSIRYRLGSVRDHMFKSPEFSTTTEAKVAANRNALGLFANFDTWKNKARDYDLWPFLIRKDGQVIDFWESLTLGTRLQDSDRCEWLTPEEYELETSEPVVMRRAFLYFLNEVSTRHSDKLSPSAIAALSYGKIYETTHLTWIREILNATNEERQTLGGMAIATLTETLQCKSLYWSIREGIYRLLNESPLILTKTAQLRLGEIQGYITAATNATWQGNLPFKASDTGEIAVKAIDLLHWAKAHNVPVDSSIEQLILGKDIGSITAKPKPGRPTDPAANLRGKRWREAAHQELQSHPNLSISDVARRIARDKYLNPGQHTEATIRKQLSKRQMIEDSYWRH